MGKFLFGICLFEQFSCFIEQNIFEQKSLGKCPWANFVCATVAQSPERGFWVEITLHPYSRKKFKQICNDWNSSDSSPLKDCLILFILFWLFYVSCFCFKKWKPFVHPFYNLKKQSDPWLTNLGCQQRFCEIDDLTCENRFFRQFVLVWISRRNGKIKDWRLCIPLIPA